MRIALVSLDQRWQDKETNFSRCTDFVRQARAHGAELIIFPEMTLTGYSLDNKYSVESQLNSSTLARFAALAKELKIPIVFGACLNDPKSAQPRNQLCFAQVNGVCGPVYSKIHPFSFVGEEKVIEAGNQLGIINVGKLVLGLSICYDLRFPELYAAMSSICNAAVVIANWPSKRVGHWRTLLVARAIENQSYMIGVNRVGTDGNHLTYEKSTCIVAPDGAVLDPLVAGEELDIYDVDPEIVDRCRTEFPTVRDKRYPLYRKFLENTDVK